MEKRAVLIVETGPAEGRDDDWNAWYDEVHIPEILEKIPGFHAATRFERPPGPTRAPEGRTTAPCTRSRPTTRPPPWQLWGLECNRGR